MGGLFGGSKSPPPPAVKPPAPMPDENDPAVLAAKRKQLADVSARGGRASTILSGPSTSGTPLGSSTIAGSAIRGNAIGGGMSVDDYENKTLGNQ